MSCRYREQTLIPPDDNPEVDERCGEKLERHEFKDGSVTWSDDCDPIPVDTRLSEYLDDAYAMGQASMQRQVDNLRANIKKALDDQYALGAFQAAETMANKGAR